MASRLLLFGGIRTPKDNLLAGLAADGILPMLDRLWLFAQPTAALALVDLIAGATATAVNSPTFTANRGYAGNGSTSYINTGFVPSTNGVQFGLTGAHISVYDRTNRTTGGAQAMMGGGNSGNTTQIRLNAGAGTCEVLVNNGFSPSASGVLTAQGFHIATRVSSTVVNYYINGAAKTLSGGTDSGAISAAALCVGALLFNGGAASFCADQVAAVTAGAALNATQAAALSSRINAYMTAIGSNVY